MELLEPPRAARRRFGAPTPRSREQRKLDSQVRIDCLLGALPEYRLVVVPNFARRITFALTAFAVMAVAVTSVLEMSCLMADGGSDSCCPKQATFTVAGCPCMAPAGPEVASSELARFAVRDVPPPMVAVPVAEPQVDLREGFIALRLESDSPPGSPPLSTMHQILRV